MDTILRAGALTAGICYGIVRELAPVVGYLAFVGFVSGLLFGLITLLTPVPA